MNDKKKNKQEQEIETAKIPKFMLWYNSQHRWDSFEILAIPTMLRVAPQHKFWQLAYSYFFFTSALLSFSFYCLYNLTLIFQNTTMIRFIFLRERDDKLTLYSYFLFFGSLYSASSSASSSSFKSTSLPVSFSPPLSSQLSPSLSPPPPLSPLSSFSFTS